MLEPETRWIRVLLIDDSPIFLGIAAKFLRRCQSIARVVTAAGGEEGVGLAREHFPEIVITDLHMPELSGLDLLPLLRSEFPRMGLIALTLQNSEGMKQTALMRGADAFVAKSDLVAELERTICRVAERKRDGLAGTS